MEINKVYQGDCLEIMKSMPDKCVDLCLTDPPYGIGESIHSHRPLKGYRPLKGSGKLKDRAINVFNTEWDISPEQIYFDEIKRISKNQIIWGGNYFNLGKCRGFIVWDKYQPWENFSQVEYAWTSYNTPAKLYKFNSKNDNIKRFHATQKPIALFQWILQNYSEPGMTVFDPFAGSGTTAIACLELKRNYILVEKEPDYVEIINRRIAEWNEQGRMF